MRNLKNLTFAFLAFGFIISLNTWAADDSAKIHNIIDTAIHPIMAEYDIPGMAVAVTVGEHTYFANYGVASREQNIPVSESTLFEIGSVSKTFTATLFSYAQQLGKISIKDHPSKYLPELKHCALDKASLLNLGTYTAGGFPMQFPDEVSNENLLNYFQQWKPVAAPGTQRQYTNVSIGLLGKITAIALKRDFADAMESQLFPALGLSHSYIHVPETAMANYAWGYDKTNKAVRVNPGVLDVETYGVKSSAADLIRYVQLNNTPQALPNTLARAIEGTHIGYFTLGDMAQGLGWEQYPYPISLEQLLAGNSDKVIWNANPVVPVKSPQLPTAPRLYNKTGSTNGFSTYIAFIPEKKLGIVILANKSYPIPARITAAYGVLQQLGQITP